MRVTAETKEETRARILEVAEALFRSNGYDQTTTRNIAERAGIGIATLFNYFSTKEAIVATLAESAFESARVMFEGMAQEGASLAEDLFAYITCELRHLKPYRKFLMPLVETTMGPLADPAGGGTGKPLRIAHLETVLQLAAQHNARGLQAPVPLQLYWTLYTGVLAFWIKDRSPKQEDTLALLDESLEMFVGWLTRNSN